MKVYKVDKDQQEIINQIISLDDQYFPFPWEPNHWKKLLPEQRFELLICLEDEQLKGFALFDASHSDNWHLLKILIDPKFQKTGLGTKFFKEVINILKQKQVNSIYLEVAMENDLALSFYKKFEFKILVEKKGFYSDGQDAFAMQLKI